MKPNTIAIVAALAAAFASLNSISLSSRMALLQARYDALGGFVDATSVNTSRILELEKQINILLDNQNRLAKLVEKNAANNLDSQESMEGILKLIDQCDQNMRLLVNRLEQEPKR